MLGQAVQKKFEIRNSKFEIISFGRTDLDITNKKVVQEKIVAVNPAVIINATGYTNVDGAETETEKAFAVNADGVGNIAEACAKIGATLFHFSTDYVFDGTQENGYTEDDIEHLKPATVYGQSKLAGEVLIQNQKSPPKADQPMAEKIKNQNDKSKLKNFKYFIIRTAWLYGAGGKNFVDTLIMRAKQGQTEFKVVRDQCGKPTFKEDLAQTVLWMIDNKEKLGSGVYYATNETESSRGISWYEFAQEIFAVAHDTGIIAQKPRVMPCTTAEFPRPARRPMYSALTNTKLPKMRGWKDALQAYVFQ